MSVQKPGNIKVWQMRHSPSEVFDGTAKAVPDVDSIWLPTDPVECGVVAAVVSAELQGAYLSFSVVRVVYRHKSCALL